MTKKILVIEDEPKHKEDAQKFFETLQDDVEVVYASTLYEAEPIMTTYDSEAHKIIPSIDGVISDIYFPLNDDPQCNQPEPIGVGVAIELSKYEIPFVLNTAGYHHGRKYQWICHLARSQDWEIIDASDCEKDADSKNWDWAYRELKEKMKTPEERREEIRKMFEK